MNKLIISQEVRNFILWNGITLDSEEGSVSFFPFFISTKPTEESVEIKMVSELLKWEKDVLIYPRDKNRLFTLEDMIEAVEEGRHSVRPNKDWLKLKYEIEL